jgi:hypothetical protein
VAHCPAELLDDLTDLLDEVRSWASVIEKKPGVFYVRTCRSRSSSSD